MEHFVYRFGALESRRAVSWLMDACCALGELHGRKLIHGDIRPSNLFVSRCDHITLLDFGLARLASPPAPARQSRVPAGTPGYMAPELLRGDSGSFRADVYAMGKLAKWLVHAEDPLRGSQQSSTDRGSTNPPQRRSLSKLTRLMDRCVSKIPRERPGNANELCSELAGTLRGSPWAQDEAQRWWKANLPGSGGPGIGQ